MVKSKNLEKKITINWFSAPEEHNYPAACSYLNLLFDILDAKRMESLLKSTSKITEFKAKDIFRASGVSLLGISNSHVEKNLKKIKKGQKLSPLLLVRDLRTGKLIIADGYHRLCGVYHYDEDAMIPCKIINSIQK